jgi:hypothetical protein
MIDGSHDLMLGREITIAGLGTFGIAILRGDGIRAIGSGAPPSSATSIARPEAERTPPPSSIPPTASSDGQAPSHPPSPAPPTPVPASAAPPRTTPTPPPARAQPGAPSTPSGTAGTQLAKAKRTTPSDAGANRQIPPPAESPDTAKSVHHFDPNSVGGQEDN